MTLITVHFKSNVLHRSTSLCAITPEVIEHLNQKNYPILYLLHGMGDDYTKWFRRTDIEQFVRNKNIIIISADFGTSFYSNMTYGDNYWDYLTIELPKIVNSLFPISSLRKDHYVAGMSMGGFGAFKWALNQPERFSAAASFSGVLNLNKFFHNDNKELLTKLNLVGNENYLSEVYTQDFGKDQIDNTENDLERLLNKQKDLPQLYQFCGKSDPLLPINQSFAKYANSINNVQLQYSSSEGGHEWNYWNKCINNFINKLSLD